MDKTDRKITATGLEQLDDLLDGGLLPGEIFLLGGRPGSGKTTLSVKMALRTSTWHKTRVLFYSLEMKKTDIYRKMSDISDSQEYEFLCLPSSSDVKKYSGMNQIKTKENDIVIIDKADTGIKELDNICKEKDAEFLIIDYLQLISNGDDKRKFSIDAVMKEIKDICKRLKIPAIVIVQKPRTKSSMAVPLRKCEEYSGIVAYISKIGSSENKERSMAIMKNRRGALKTFPLSRLNPAGTRYIDFGTLGLKIGDEISFKPTGEIFHVGSGNGTPGNGGTLIRLTVPDSKSGCSLFSIRAMTRSLRDGDLPYDLDVYQLWTYQGKTLLEIYEQM